VVPVLGPALKRLRRSVARSRAQLRFRDLVLAVGSGNLWVFREDLARRYLTGDGIEVGALTLPLRVPPGVRVRHVDRMSTADLVRVEGPSLRAAGLDPALIPEIDVVDDAERLAKFADRSVDFVIANHVLEHTEDPIGSLENLLRVIRPGGVLFLTLPDPRYTFDSDRSRTTVEHLLRDHAEGPEGSRRQHYEEWARAIERLPEERIPERVEEFARARARHHFHVWELEDFLGLLRAAELPCALVHAQAYLKEFAVILRRTAPVQAGAKPPAQLRSSSSAQELMQ
jgi:predicted SAM-dependent methyltransferase